MSPPRSGSSLRSTIAKAAANADSGPQYEVSLLPEIPPGQELYLQFDGINGWVPGRFAPPTLWETLSAAAQRLRKGKDAAVPAIPPRKQILFSVTGHVRPGEVLALMGPSGSGKTSLLSVLAGRVPKMMDVKGTMVFNGKPLVKATKRRIGYVLQDDLLYETLTVYETLKFAAQLRLPSEMSRAVKLERVEVVLAALGLQNCKHTIIGGPMRRGVSGGERKRVSVGHELLINPSMIMLDEPTSGLDSTTAMHLITLLRALAAGNRAILTTIHQPSSRLYQQLDQLMLLSQGHMMYYGAGADVANWFSTLGFPVPFGVNVADFILDLAMGEVASADGTVTGGQAVRSMYSTYEQFSFRTQGSGYFKGCDAEDLQLLVVNDDGSFSSHHVVSPVQDMKKVGSQRDFHSMASVVEEEGAAAVVLEGDSGSKERGGEGGTQAVVHLDLEAGHPAITSSSDEGEDEKAPPAGKGGYHHNRRGASYYEQVRVLLVRCSKVKRFEAYSTQAVVQTVMIALLCGMFWWQRGNKGTVEAASDASGLVFFALLFPAMRCIFGALFTFPADYRMLVKERASGMYRLSAFYLARTASDFPMECVLPGIFFTICYWMGGLRPDAGVFFASLFTLLLLVLVAQSFGLLIGGAAMDPKTAQTISTIIIMTFMLVAGFYVKNIPSWIAWTKYLSFIYWAYDLGMKIQFNGAIVMDCSVSPCVPVSDLQSALHLSMNPNGEVWPNILVLFGMLVGLRFVIYWTLRFKTSQR